MAKKRNYENDEAYKNFRVEDLLPEMKWREPEAKALEPIHSRNIIKLQITDNHTQFGIHSKSKSF